VARILSGCGPCAFDARRGANASRDDAKSAKANAKNAYFFVFSFALIIALFAASRLELR